MGGGGMGGGGDLPPESGGTANPNNKRLPLMYFEDYGVNPFVDADEDPLSTFALDGDTASYAVARRYLSEGWLPEPESVRTEEYVNAFGSGYSPSTEGLSLHLDAAPAPFAPDGYVLLRVGVAAPAFPEERDPVSLIFIVDVSGSMEYDNRLGAAKLSDIGFAGTEPSGRPDCLGDLQRLGRGGETVCCDRGFPRLGAGHSQPAARRFHLC